MSDEAQPTAADAPADAPTEQPYSEYPTGDAPAMEEAPPPRGVKGLLTRKIFKVPVFAILGIVVLLLVGAAVGSSGMLNKTAATPPMKMVSMSGNYDYKGPQVLVGKTDQVPVQFNSTNSSTVTNVCEVTVIFSFSDPKAGYGPDTMLFELLSPDGQNKSSTVQGTSGTASLTLTSNVTDKKMDDNTKGWIMKTTCVKTGTKKVGPIGLLVYTDPGQDYSAKVSYKYYGHPGAKAKSAK